jgi:hypothetical protein
MKTLIAVVTFLALLAFPVQAQQQIEKGLAQAPKALVEKLRDTLAECTGSHDAMVSWGASRVIAQVASRNITEETMAELVIIAELRQAFLALYQMHTVVTGILVTKHGVDQDESVAISNGHNSLRYSKTIASIRAADDMEELITRYVREKTDCESRMMEVMSEFGAPGLKKKP